MQKGFLREAAQEKGQELRRWMASVARDVVEQNVALSLPCVRGGGGEVAWASAGRS